MTQKLTSKQRELLEEALRRFWLFHKDEDLQHAWTGLGTYTTYKPVLDAGLMDYATSPNPRYVTWFRLTEKGAAIVQEWIDSNKYEAIVQEWIDSNKYEIVDYEILKRR